MKTTYEECATAIRTKSEQSLIVKDLWISRSVIALRLPNKTLPIFGFAVKNNRQKSETSSFYEVLEHLVFLPYLYDEASAKRLVAPISGAFGDNTIKDFLIGSKGPKGIFYGNGCAISNNINSAKLHSKRELLERHICCEIWYNKNRLLHQENELEIESFNCLTNISTYSTNSIDDGVFVMATLSCEKMGFFVIGAAIRDNLELASQHAIGETVMLFEDVLKKRDGISTTERSQTQILSLRDRETSKLRKTYFHNLREQCLAPKKDMQPICHTIAFEPFSNLFAARTFSDDCLDPRSFESRTDVPIMPLF